MASETVEWLNGLMAQVMPKQEKERQVSGTKAFATKPATWVSSTEPTQRRESVAQRCPLTSTHAHWDTVHSPTPSYETNTVNIWKILNTGQVFETQAFDSSTQKAKFSGFESSNTLHTEF